MKKMDQLRSEPCDICGSTEYSEILLECPTCGRWGCENCIPGRYRECFECEEAEE